MVCLAPKVTNMDPLWEPVVIRMTKILMLDVSEETKLWLHRTDKTNFPFRISGGWQDEESTHKLNVMVNLLATSSDEWISFLAEQFNDSNTESPKEFIDNKIKWLERMLEHLKGDTWEVEIMKETISQVKKQVEEQKSKFLK